MIDVRVADNFIADGVDIWVRMTFGPGHRRILRFRDDGAHWDDAAEGTVQGPTMTLTDGAGRALLEQLLRHYAGAQDLHTVRADLLHERGRVDQLMNAMIDLAQIGARRDHA